ncbi:MAG: hypothetical protein QMD04_10995 [Anaerolineales bacterium]|nr:hypothetical protein [Anaerolineales bacterium]
MKNTILAIGLLVFAVALACNLPLPGGTSAPSGTGTPTPYDAPAPPSATMAGLAPPAAPPRCSSLSRPVRPTTGTRWR